LPDHFQHLPANIGEPGFALGADRLSLPQGVGRAAGVVVARFREGRFVSQSGPCYLVACKCYNITLYLGSAAGKAMLPKAALNMECGPCVA